MNRLITLTLLISLVYGLSLSQNMPQANVKTVKAPNNVPKAQNAPQEKDTTITVFAYRLHLQSLSKSDQEWLFNQKWYGEFNAYQLRATFRNSQLELLSAIPDTVRIKIKVQ